MTAMSDQEQQEDVKPKLNLNVAFEGNHITVKVKPTMKLSKIFEAAEKRFGKDPGTLRFTFEGQRLNRDDTPGQLGMEDNDQIDAFIQQLGGRRSITPSVYSDATPH